MFYRSFFLSLLMSMASIILVGQQPNDSMTYMHMTGTADSANLQANFLRQSEQISGNLEFSDTGVSVTYDMQGLLNEQNGASLTPYGSDYPELRGVFVDEQFTGLWRDGKKETEVGLIESYPPGSVSLDVYYLHSEANLISDNQESPTAEIELTLLYPAEDAHVKESVKDSLKKIIGSHYTSNPAPGYPDSVLVHAEQDFYNLYRENSDGWEEMKWAFGWTKMNEMHVLNNANGILCLEYLNYVYTGGAHGMTNQFYDIINLNSGRKLTFGLIFKKEKESEIADLINRQLRKANHLSDTASLKDAGFFVDAVETTGNIYVNGSGMGFTYSQYEIAPYAMGIITVFIEYEQLKNLIQEQSPVWKLAEHSQKNE